MGLGFKAKVDCILDNVAFKAGQPVPQHIVNKLDAEAGDFIDFMLIAPEGGVALDAIEGLDAAFKELGKTTNPAAFNSIEVALDKKMVEAYAMPPKLVGLDMAKGEFVAPNGGAMAENFKASAGQGGVSVTIGNSPPDKKSLQQGLAYLAKGGKSGLEPSKVMKAEVASMFMDYDDADEYEPPDELIKQESSIWPKP